MGFINEAICPALKMGGVLNIVRYEVELNCLPTSIPEKITVDLSEAKIGDSIHISAVELPEGVTPTITDRDNQKTLKQDINKKEWKKNNPAKKTPKNRRIHK